MIKKLLLSSMLFAAVGAMAAPISPDEALGRLSKSDAQRLPSKLLTTPKLQKTIVAANGEAAMYVFGNGNNRGYLIMSADDCTIPLLGYSDSGEFNEETMAPGFQYWLDSYARQISYLKSSNVKLAAYTETDGALPEWEPVAPLIKTKWDQGAPYNDLCPTVGGVHCYTGCVATSLSQVMKYYQYPLVGEGNISYRCGSLGQTLSMNLAEAPFDYANMIDIYQRGEYTPEQANAVATIMKAAGYAVEMNYQTSVSGALSAMLVQALVKNFKYDNQVFYYDRSIYEYNEWAAMVYDNISKGQPVIYDGTAPNSGGHSFICDGYDGNGYFHFNWGWSGMSDGYYVLDSLNPSSIGIGGYAGGFNFDQDAVMGIKPAEPGSTATPAPKVVSQYGALFGILSGNNLSLGVTDSYPYLGWGYTGTESTVMSFGLIIQKEDGTGDPIYHKFSMYSDIPFGIGLYVEYKPDNFSGPRLSLAGLELEKGSKYKFTFASLNEREANAQWTPVVAYLGYPNYIYITAKEEGYELENIPPAHFEASGLELLSTLYYGCPVKAKVNISNNTEYQLSRGVCIVLCDEQGTQKFRGDSFFLTLDPGETIEKEWVSAFSLVNGSSAVNSNTEFLAYLYDLETGIYYDSEGYPVTMEPNPGTPVLMTNITIDNAPKEGNNYIVDNTREMDVNLRLAVGSGYFSYPLSIHVLESRQGSSYLFSVLSQTFEEVPFLNKGESETLSTVLDFPNPVPGQTYFMQSAYSVNSSYTWMNNQITFIAKGAGVDGLTSDLSDVKFYHDRASQTLTVFGAEGCKEIRGFYINGAEAGLDVVYNGDTASVSLANLGKGIIVIQVIDKDGKTHSAKVAL